VVAKLREDLQNAKSVILTSYQGIPVNTINELRAKFRAADVEYHTVKNTLARLAIAGTDKEPIGEFLSGPIAMAYSQEDAISPAKVVKEFNKENDKFEVRGGILEGELLDEAGVTRLAELPTKDELRVTVLRLFAAGPTQLLRTLSAGPQELLRVFEAKRMAEEG
jgi:large subunit ribosomal protein L10